MAELVPFKEMVNAEAVGVVARQFARAHEGFDHVSFESAVLDRLAELELKDRIRHIAAQLHHHLPPDFDQAVTIVRRAAQGAEIKGMIAWSLCQFVEDRGLQHFEPSMAALHELTSLWSAEFAVRPFLLHMPDRTVEHLITWATDDDHHVRRLVSEGTRTRLPWGQRLPHFIADPDPVFDLLERLKDDPELYVRRSVANNLNDLSKDHPQRVVTVLTRWLREGGEHREWIAGHALRTLVKKGDQGALSALGYGPAQVELVRLEVPQTVQFGDALRVSVELANAGSSASRLMIDYAVHHVKNNGTRTAKVFKWSKRTLGAGERVCLTKKHRIKAISTRKYYPGMHALEVLVNGQSLGVREFELLM